MARLIRPPFLTRNQRLMIFPEPELLYCYHERYLLYRLRQQEYFQPVIRLPAPVRNYASREQTDALLQVARFDQAEQDQQVAVRFTCQVCLN